MGRFENHSGYEARVNFSTEKVENFLRMVEILVQEGYQLIVQTDVEGVYMIEGVIPSFDGLHYILDEV